MDENVIDFGKWVVPTEWSQVTLRQFQEIEKYYSDKDRKFDVRNVLHIFTDRSVDDINALPISFVEELMNKLVFLNEKPQFDKPRNYIDIDGERYSINVMERLKTGEFCAVDSILKNDPYDYVSIFAIICRKDGEVYDSKFEAEVFEKRVELFGKQPIMEVMPMISFFLNLYVVRKTPSLLYSEAEDALNLIQQSIDNSENLGVFKKRSLNWRMKRLRKLLKSSKST